jgi:Ala-tRNA(Pro) deacylase
MTHETFLKIKNMLDDNNVRYEHFTHEHVHTSQDAASVRDTSLDDAAKAIILKAKDDSGKEIFLQCVIQASQRIDLKKIKALFGVKNAALASPEEVLEKTGCTIGSVPPFGILFGLKVYMDRELLNRGQIVFSAGTHTDSIMVSAKDYADIVKPVVDDFRKVS